MSLLETLALFSHSRQNVERSYSVESKNHLANSNVEVCHVVTKERRHHSKSLSKQNLSEKPQMVRSMSRVLNRLFMTLNKKLRIIRYYVFIKLQGYKKSGSVLSRKNSQSSICQAPKNNQLKPKMVLESIGVKMQRMAECIDLLNFRHYERHHKETAVKALRKHGQRVKKHINLSVDLQRILEQSIKCTVRNFFQILKCHSKQHEVAELFYSQLSILFRQISSSNVRLAFRAIKSYSDCPPISYRPANEYPLHLPLTDAHYDISHTNNETLTFSNLMDNGDSYDEIPYMQQKRSEHNLDLVIPVQISNIRPQPIFMRKYRPYVPDDVLSNNISIRVQNEPMDISLPERVEKYAKQLSRLQPDICINAINEQGDNAMLFLQNPQQQSKSLLRNESFINCLKLSDVRDSVKELRSVHSQQLLKPPVLSRQQSSSSHDSRRQSQVQMFTMSKAYGQNIYEEQPTNHTDEKLLFNPEERKRNQFFTPKRADRPTIEGPATPINELKIHYPERQEYRPRNYESYQTKNQQSAISYEAPAYKSRTSEFYMEYLRSLRKNNQVDRPIKPQEEEASMYDPNTYFGSRSYKNLSGNC